MTMAIRTFQRYSEIWAGVTSILDKIAPLAFLLLRAWVAWAFFKSGYLKITSWDTTLYLFENEYAVPVLSPVIAAYVATFIELAFPLLLTLGLGGRASALVLFAFNIMAVISYPGLDALAARDHQWWGLILFLLATAGCGRFTVDAWMARHSRSPAQ